MDSGDAVAKQAAMSDLRKRPFLPKVSQNNGDETEVKADGAEQFEAATKAYVDGLEEESSERSGEVRIVDLSERITTCFSAAADVIRELRAFLTELRQLREPQFLPSKRSKAPQHFRVVLPHLLREAH